MACLGLRMLMRCLSNDIAISKGCKLLGKSVLINLVLSALEMLYVAIAQLSTFPIASGGSME